MDSEKPILRRAMQPARKPAVIAKKSGFGREASKPRTPKQNTVTVEITENELVLRLSLIPAEQRKISKSGKSIICAGTSGTKVATRMVNGELIPVEINGKNMRVCATAWIGHGPVVSRAGYHEENLEQVENADV